MLARNKLGFKRIENKTVRLQEHVNYANGVGEGRGSFEFILHNLMLAIAVSLYRLRSCFRARKVPCGIPSIKYFQTVQLHAAHFWRAVNPFLYHLVSYLSNQNKEFLSI